MRACVWVLGFRCSSEDAVQFFECCVRVCSASAFWESILRFELRAQRGRTSPSLRLRRRQQQPFHPLSFEQRRPPPSLLFLAPPRLLALLRLRELLLPPATRARKHRASEFGLILTCCRECSVRVEFRGHIAHLSMYCSWHTAYRLLKICHDL